MGDVSGWKGSVGGGGKETQKAFGCRRATNIQRAQPYTENQFWSRRIIFPHH